MSLLPFSARFSVVGTKRNAPHLSIKAQLFENFQNLRFLAYTCLTAHPIGIFFILVDSPINPLSKGNKHMNELCVVCSVGGSEISMSWPKSAKNANFQ